jgi:hypothetical protein
MKAKALSVIFSVLSLSVSLTMSIASQQSFDYRNSAIFAFRKAEAELAFLNYENVAYGYYLDLARAFSLFDPHKVHKYISIADQALNSQIQKYKAEMEKRENDKKKGVFFISHDNLIYSIYLRAGLSIYKIDPSMSRQYFKYASEICAGDDYDSTFDRTRAEIGIAILDGENKKAIEKALDFCAMFPEKNIEISGANMITQTRNAMVMFLRDFEPEIAVEFASDYDQLSYLELLVSAARFYEQVNPKLSKNYYSRIAKMGFDDNLQEGSFHIFSEAIMYLSEDDLYGTLKLFGSEAFNDYRQYVQDELLKKVARRNIKKAIQVIGERSNSEQQRLMPIVAVEALSQDPTLIDKIQEMVDEKQHDLLFKTTAISFSKRGNTNSALKMLEKIKEKDVFQSTSVEIARNIIRKDKSTAMSLLDRAFKDYFNRYRKEQATDIAALIYQLDQNKGRALFSEIFGFIENTMSNITWSDYCYPIKVLVSLDKKEGLDAFKRMQNFKTWNVREIIYGNYTDILPDFASIDPDFAAEILKTMLSDERYQSQLHNYSKIINKIAMSLAKDDEKRGIMLFNIIRDEKLQKRERQKFITDLLITKIKDNPEHTDNLLGSIETFFPESLIQTEIRKNIVVGLAETNVEVAMNTANSLRDSHEIGNCISAIFQKYDIASNKAEKLISSINDPYWRMQTWLDLGMIQAYKVPEWRVKLE